LVKEFLRGALSREGQEAARATEFLPSPAALVRDERRTLEAGLNVK